MAAITDTSGDPSNGGSAGTNPSSAGTNPSSAGGAVDALKHDPGLAKVWTPEEQAHLEQLLIQYASQPVIVRFGTIAKLLKDKTIRDIAFRCQWMAMKESGKRRKAALARKIKYKMDKLEDPSAKPSSQLAAGPSARPYALPIVNMDNDDDISYKAIVGVSEQILEHNIQILNQISANLTQCQIQENIRLFHNSRDNISKLLDDLNDMPEIMKKMPPLPVMVNKELINCVLPGATMPLYP